MYGACATDVGTGLIVPGGEMEDDGDVSFLLTMSSTDHILGLGTLEVFCLGCPFCEGAVLVGPDNGNGCVPLDDEEIVLLAPRVSLEAGVCCPLGDGGGVIGTTAVPEGLVAVCCRRGSMG